MISDFKELSGLFAEMDKDLDQKVRVYVIGGAMLLYHGMKQATKDIDIVVDKEPEFNAIQNILKKLKFTTKAPASGYKKVDLSHVFIREDFRIDLFHKTVCKGFQLSEAMMKRASQILRLEHISVSLCSPEDVFLFKTLTEREGDLEDCISLARGGLDWDAILGELQEQIRASGNNIWITWVGERMDTLKERGLVIPIMGEIDKMRISYFEGYENNKD